MRDEQLLIWNDYLPRVVVVVVLEELFGGVTAVQMLFRPVQAVPQPPAGEEEMN